MYHKETVVWLERADLDLDGQGGLVTYFLSSDSLFKLYFHA